MKFTCNIDTRGRKARLVTGIAIDLAGLALALTGALNGDTKTLLTGVVLSLAGSFMILEGMLSWCALRALGFKTKL